MEMGTGEIRRKYKYAKNKKKCISILAELNDCNIGEIESILGLGLQEEHDAKADGAKIKLNTHEINSLYARFDELDAAIKPLEDEYRRMVQMILSAESG